MHCHTQCPQPCSRPPPTHASAGDSWTLKGKSGSHSCAVSFLWGHCSFPPGPRTHEVLFVPSKSLFPQSCVIPGGSVVGLTATSSERLCHTQVCCTQSPCPCGRTLLTRTSTGDTQTQFGLSLCGVSGSWCAQGLFEPSENLWQQFRPSYHLARASPLPSGVGYLLTNAPMPTVLLGFLFGLHMAPFESESESHTFLSNSVIPWTVACPAPLSMKFSMQNTGVGCYFLPQGIFLTQGSKPGLLNCRQILYQLSH